MSDVLETLTAALNEIEAVARAATPGPWVSHRFRILQDKLPGMAYVAARAEDLTDAAHIALNDPAAVLRMAAGARAILNSCRRDYEDAMASGDDTTSLAEEVITALAAMFAAEPEQATEARA